MTLSAAYRVATTAVSILLLGSCTTAMYSTQTDLMGPGCYHKERPWSEYECPDTNRSNMFLVQNVASATLTVTLSNGTTRTLTIPANTDAIFLSKAAVENFLLRHYDATNSARADQLRHDLRTHWR